MFFMKRISKGAPDDRLEKGALRPELAFLLNWLSRPERTDVFLDPFAGSGAIPFSRARMAGFRQMYVFDKQKEMVAALRGKAAALGEKKQAVVIEAVEVAGLPNALPGQCVDKIVTDPPWGYYEDVDVAALYQRMLRAFRAVTRPGARIVVLSAQKEIMERTVREHADVFEAVCVYHILVSGKKAGVFVLTRGAS